MKLETSVELLERVRAKHGSSWYGLGRLVGAHENTIGSWKAGRTIVDRKFAPRIAELLDESPEYVLLCLEHERETSPEVRKIWRRLAGLITHSAASILLGTVSVLGLLPLPTQDASAQGAPSSHVRSVYYVKLLMELRRRLRAWLGRRLLDRPQHGLRSVTAAAI